MPRRRIKKLSHHQATSHVKRNDTVVVLAGGDKDHRGRVLEALPRLRKVRVESVQMIWRHRRPRGRQTALEQQRGRIQMPALIDAAKVMVVCPNCDKPTRPRWRVNDRGQKVRACHRCKGIIDEPGMEMER